MARQGKSVSGIRTQVTKSAERTTVETLSSLLFLLWLAATQAGCTQADSADTEVEKSATQSTDHAVTSDTDVEAVEPELNQRFAPAPSIGETVELYDDAVVFITVSDAMGEDVSVGSGCVIDKSGLIATNHHVIEEAVSARVHLHDGTRLPVAGVAAVDESHDLAILHVENLPDSIEQFDLRAPPRLRPGDALIAIGHPMSFRFTVSDGILSALRRTDELPALYKQGWHSNPETEWLQTTAAISNGSSGGPLMTPKGDLVGINTWVAAGRDLGFAVSVKHLVELVTDVALPSRPLPLPDSPVVVGRRVAVLSHDFQKELQSLFVAISSAGSTDTEGAWLPLRDLVARTAANCLAIMEDSSSESDRVDALLLAHQVLSGYVEGLLAGRRHFEKMYTLAGEHLVNSGEVCRAIALIANGPYSHQMSSFLRKVFRTHPLKAVRVRAGLALVAAMQQDQNAHRYIPERIELLERLEQLYGDIPIAGIPTTAITSERLRRLRSLSVGSSAPQLVGHDRDGAPVRLIDHRGKVVVVDFWADWLPECRNMYSQKRELVKKFKSQPFVLISVNCDDTPQAIAGLTDSGNGVSFDLHDGPQGHLAQQWLVERLPQTFVFDPRGVVRFIDRRGQELEDAIHALLEARVVEFPGDVVEANSNWRWYYDEQPPPEDWATPAFNDSHWASGPAPLGYGRPRVATALDYGDIDRKLPTACFRKCFELADPLSCDRLILQLDADDGAIVYLNGAEVFRTRLPSSASWTSLASLPADSSVTAELDTDLLVAGRNLIAVEIHQVDPQSADLFFDLSLSSRSLDAESVLTAKSRLTRRKFCQLVAELPDHDTLIHQALETLSKDADAAARTWALVARIKRSAVPGDVWLPDSNVEDQAARRTVAASLSQRVWEVVGRPDCSAMDYQRALSAAAAAWRLRQTAEPRQVASAANTYGVALYRVRDFQRAAEFLRKSMSLRGENPLDLAYLAMTLERLGEHAGARESFSKAAAYSTRPGWAAEDAASRALDEARKELASDVLPTDL